MNVNINKYIDRKFYKRKNEMKCEDFKATFTKKDIDSLKSRAVCNYRQRAVIQNHAAYDYYQGSVIQHFQQLSSVLFTFKLMSLCCYYYSISAVTSSGPFQVFVNMSSPRRISKKALTLTLYFLYRSRLFSFK